MGVNKGILVVMLWTTCQLGVSAQLIDPSRIGTPCRSDDRCNAFIPYSACISNVCGCVPDYVPSSVKDSCLPVAKNLYDPCDEPIQCTESFGPGAECSGAKGCTCVPTNHFVPSLLKCIENKGLGDKCSYNTDCYLPDDGTSQHVECVDQICKCITGYNPNPDGRSCISSAATQIISITCLVGVWILHLSM